MQNKTRSFIFSLLVMLFTISTAGADMSLQLKLMQLNNGADYSKPGTSAYSSHMGSLNSNFGCTIKYTEYRPENPATETTLVLGHGFFRNQKTQVLMAQHFASWGFHTVTLDFCNSKPWNGHHDRNGKDMITLSKHLGSQQVIYAGFSAGGLAAYLAAAEDENCVGYLGLDMVDNFDKGLKAAPNFSKPGFAMIAEPSMCNAKGNGLTVFKNTLHKPELVKIHGASHCDFEFPYDGKCSLACGKTRKPYAREDVQSIILGLSTSALYSLSQTKHQSENWWNKTDDIFKYLQQNSLISFPDFD